MSDGKQQKLEEAQNEILESIKKTAATTNSHRVLHLANAYALLEGTIRPEGAHDEEDYSSA